LVFLSKSWIIWMKARCKKFRRLWSKITPCTQATLALTYSVMLSLWY
jgi:hypothetical protein